MKHILVKGKRHLNNGGPLWADLPFETIVHPHNIALETFHGRQSNDPYIYRARIIASEKETFSVSLAKDEYQRIARELTQEQFSSEDIEALKKDVRELSVAIDLLQINSKTPIEQLEV